MDLNLNGKTALVTGASKGIGLAVAKLLAAEGCNLHLVARGKETLETAREAIRKCHQIAVALHPLDLSRSESVGQLAEACGDIDILINNAGAIPGGTLAMVDEARWRAAWDLKVFGYINLTRAFLALMEARGRGVIVNVVGLAGEKMDAGYVAGSAGNAALIAFTKAVGSTSLDKGVRVLGCNPGPVETDRIATLMKTRAEREVADLVAFLASDRAAYISGTVTNIDGGLGARN